MTQICEGSISSGCFKLRHWHEHYVGVFFTIPFFRYKAQTLARSLRRGALNSDIDRSITLGCFELRH